MHSLMILLATSILLSVSGSVSAENPVQKDPPRTAIHSIELPNVSVQLKPGPGLDKVSTLCNICHSVDYITMQPPFPRAQWTATVNKMIKVLGAPINDEDAKTIVDYLAANYGTGK